jgi:chromosome segregation ATPase
MAKKISSSDLFSQEDLFKGVRDSAQSALVMINQLNAAMKTSAEGLKASIKSADLGSASGLKGFNQAASEANQLKEEAIRLEILQKKLTSEMNAAEKQRLSTERERLKLENDLIKAAARSAKTDVDKDSTYKALVKNTRELKNMSKELAAQMVMLERSGEKGTAQFNDLSEQYEEVTKQAKEADSTLKEIDQNVGDSQRNVGNYAEAVGEMGKEFKSAKAELRALTNELLNMKRGTPEFEVARKRASDLKDEISDLSQELNAGAGNAFEQVAGNTRLFGQRLLDLDLKGAGAALTNMGSAVRQIDFKTIRTEVGGLVNGMKDLGKATLGNPWFLAAAALTALVVYWDDIKNAVNGTTKNVEKLTNANNGLERQNKILEGKLELEQVSNENSNYAIKLQTEMAKNSIKTAQNELEIKRQLGDINGVREAENKLIEARNYLTTL